jgi:uncharacterized protein YecT (DUF1311 family)
VTGIRVFILLAIFIGAPNVLANPKPHAIDISMSDCLKKPENMTTAGIANCTIQAEKKWRAEVERLYEGLLGHLDENGKSALKNSQKAWLIFRDKEIKAINVMYAPAPGTMYAPVKATNVMQISKSRAIALQNYINIAGK